MTNGRTQLQTARAGAFAEVGSNHSAVGPSSRLSVGRVLMLTMVSYVTYLYTVSRFVNYSDFTKGYGDNSPYVAIASAIEHWDFSQLHVKLFWGLPYAVTALSAITRIPNLPSLIVISGLASLAAIILTCKLWGGWVAVAFVILSREWLERSLLGGAEPLFLALLFGAFLAARKQRWGLAASLASLATVVRPMGIFALAGIGIALLFRRDFRKLAAAAAIGLAIGTLYALPLKLYVGDSLANVNGYGQADWNSKSPVSFPFAAIVHNALGGSATELNLARSGVWIAFILLAAILIARKVSIREYSKSLPMEATFWALYLIFLFTYNSPWARDQFPRFAIPLVPFSAFSMERWIPRSYWLLLILGLVSAVLSATETVGIMNVVGMVRKAI